MLTTRWTRWAFALIAAFLSIAAAFALRPALSGQHLEAPFLLAVVVAGLVAGPGPALFCAAAGGAALVLLLQPFGSFSLAFDADLFGILFYAATAVAVTLVTSAHRRALARSRADADRADRSLRAAHESDARFGAMADAAPLLIWLTDEHGEITFLNRTWREFTGGPTGSGKSMPAAAWAAAVHPDDLASIRAKRQTAFATRTPLRCEYRLRACDGCFRWVLDTGTPRTDADGAFVGFIGSAADINDLKLAQDRARDHEELLELAVRGSRSGVWDIRIERGRDGALRPADEMYVSPSLKALLGYDDHALPSTRSAWQALIHEKDRAAVAQTVTRHLAAPGDDYQVEYRATHRDGSTCWIQSRGRIVRDPAGIPVRMTGIDTDITSLKRATEEAASWRDRYELAIASTNQVLFHWHISSNASTFGPNIRDVLGYAPEELNGDLSRYTALIHPDDLPGIQEQMQRSLATGIAEVSNYRIRHKDGRYIAIRASGRYYTDAQGRPELAVGFIWDVTRERSAEEALRRSEADFRALFNAVGVAKVQLDARTGGLLRVNAKACELTGFSREELLSLRFADLLNEADREEDDALRARLFVGERTEYTRESRVVRKDGTPIWTSITVTLARDEDGQASRLIAVLHDISHRHEAEERIRELNRDLNRRVDELQTLLDVVPVGIAFSFDPRCSDIRTNPAAARLLGIAPDENASKSGPAADRLPFRVLQNGVELTPDALPMQHCARTGESIRGIELDIVRSDGQTVTLSEYASPLFDENGKVRGCIGVFVDITERKQAENALRESRRALRLAIESADIGTWDYQPDDGTIHWSPRLREIFGVGDVLTVTMTEFFQRIHPNDMEAAAEAVAHALDPAGDGHLDAEFRILRTDGAIRWVLFKGQAQFETVDGRTTAVRFAGTGIDVTESKHADAAIRASEVKFRALYDSNVVPIAFWSAEGRILDANDAALRVLGFTRDELLRGEARWDTITDPAHIERDRHFIEELTRTGRGRPFEKDYLLRNGRRVPVLVGGALLPGSADTGVSFAIDLSEQKLAERAARTAQERLRIALASAGMAVWEWDFERDFVECSPGSEELLGFTIAHAATFLGLVHADDSDRFLDWLRALRAGGDPADLEYRIRRPDRPERWVVSHARAEGGTPSAPARVIGVTVDITDRHAAQQARLQSEERLRAMFESDVIGVVTADVHGGIMQANDEFLRIIGYTRDDLETGRIDWSRLTPEEQLPVDFEHISEARLRGSCTPWEKQYIRKDGSKVWVYLGFVLLEPERDVAVCFVLDISDRKAAEDALRQSEARFRELADAMPQIVWTARPDGHLDYYNKRWYEFTGSSPDVFGDESWRDVIHPDDLDRTHARWQQSLKTGQVYEIEIRYRDRRGNYLWHLVRALPIRNDRDEIVRWYGTSTNINDHKLALEQLAQSVEALNRSNLELEEFAYVASHDLKEPLRGIRNYASFVIEDYGDLLNDDGRRKLQTIDRLGKRMDELISSLLHYSRVGRTEMAIANTDLNEVLAGVLDTLAPAIAEKRVEVRIPKRLPIIRCDRVRVTEVFHNLVANAVKYNTGADPFVEIGVDEPPTPGQPPVFFVRDNGIGIPEKHRETVFKMFERLHGRDDFGGGTGAGLAFVKRIVELHGGRVWVQSTPGHGSTFYLTLQKDANAHLQLAHSHH